MTEYRIMDIWMALRLAFTNFVIVSLIGALLSVVLGFQDYLMPLLAAVFIQSVLIYRANSLYLVDSKHHSFTFPRSDIENSIWAILILQPYWNLMRRQTVRLADIENIYLDTKRWQSEQNIVSGNTAKGKTKFKKITKKHVRYCLNVAGRFGSANLAFLNRQKRDEVRNALQQSIANHKVDCKVAELA